LKSTKGIEIKLGSERNDCAQEP